LLEKLKSLAFNAQKNAYAPYSKFYVGAAILGDDDQYYAGCNVENAAYPLGQCAEASAIGAMATAGCKAIKHIVIASPTDDYCFPCGGCRQKIAEFASQDTPVTMITQNGAQQTLSVAELIPQVYTLSTE
jgi:cytidine deaminase